MDNLAVAHVTGPDRVLQRAGDLRFGQRLEDHGILASMGSVGDSYDNPLMENFFSTLKTELVHRQSWRSREEAENALFAYIDGWYNDRPSTSWSAFAYAKLDAQVRVPPTQRCAAVPGQNTPISGHSHR